MFVISRRGKKKFAIKREGVFGGAQREIDSSERGIFRPLKFLVVEVRSSPFFLPRNGFGLFHFAFGPQQKIYKGKVRL